MQSLGRRSASFSGTGGDDASAERRRIQSGPAGAGPARNEPGDSVEDAAEGVDAPRQSACGPANQWAAPPSIVDQSLKRSPACPPWRPRVASGRRPRLRDGNCRSLRGHAAQQAKHLLGNALRQEIAGRRRHWRRGLCRAGFLRAFRSLGHSARRIDGHGHGQIRLAARPPSPASPRHSASSPRRSRAAEQRSPRRTPGTARACPIAVNSACNS